MRLRIVVSLSLLLGLSLASNVAVAQAKKPVAKAAAATPAKSPAAKSNVNDPLIDIMQAELDRATGALATADPAPYFVSYSVETEDALVMVASDGALLTSARTRRRSADVTMRIGTAALDNTHDDSRPSGITSGQLPLENDKDAIARELWRLTDREYKQASKAFLNVKTKTAVKAKEEDDSPDYSQETVTPQKDLPHAAPLTVDQKAWEDRLRRISGEFRKYPKAYRAIAVLYGAYDEHRFVSSEKNRFSTVEPLVRLMLMAQTTADDGMELLRVETFDGPDLASLPSEQDLIAKVDVMGKDLEALRSAPLAEPFNGPALLSGRAAAVFFHEVLGHRVEGQRQRGDDEGQTFTKQVGKPILPAFLSVVDDPTLQRLGGVRLAGSYAYDDEGVPASRVQVVKDGVLQEFLMSRLPVKNFSHSNGHGRAQAGFMQVGRQGNLIVSSTSTVDEKTLRARFVDEIKKANKPYGLYFEDIQGGFTLTSRSLPQAFQVLPVMVWKVYADGRPDELVRGVDIVGTPIAALNRILVTGDKQAVFNGVCGAESGNVPVSAAAPAMLFSEIEVQKRQQGRDRPPILPAPEADAAAGGKN